MRTVFIVIWISLASCVNIEVTEKYQLYFDDSSYHTFQKGLQAYNEKNFLLSDSLLSLVIDNSKDKLSLSMPISLNPYYYRGHTDLELEQYHQALTDFDNVATDTTTVTDIILGRHLAFKALRQFDTAIALCDKLLTLKVDSSVILSQRGLCYYQIGQLDKACADFRVSVRLSRDSTFLKPYMKDCK